MHAPERRSCVEHRRTVVARQLTRFRVEHRDTFRASRELVSRTERQPCSVRRTWTRDSARHSKGAQRQASAGCVPHAGLSRRPRAIHRSRPRIGISADVRAHHALPAAHSNGHAGCAHAVRGPPDLSGRRPPRPRRVVEASLVVEHAPHLPSPISSARTSSGATAPGPRQGSPPRRHGRSIFRRRRRGRSTRGAGVEEAPSGHSSRPQFAAVRMSDFEPGLMDRLTDDVIRRVERRVRIERERRGL